MKKSRSMADAEKASALRFGIVFSIVYAIIYAMLYFNLFDTYLFMWYQKAPELYFRIPSYIFAGLSLGYLWMLPKIIPSLGSERFYTFAFPIFCGLAIAFGCGFDFTL